MRSRLPARFSVMEQPDWQRQARERLKDADAALRNESVVRAVGLISEARFLLPDRSSPSGHLFRSTAALLMADAWSSAGDLDAADSEIQRARSHAQAARRDSQSHLEARVLGLKAHLAGAYVDECAGEPSVALARARRAAKDRFATPEIGVLAVARWIASAVKGGSVKDAAAAESHLSETFGDALSATPVPTEARALLLRWMAVFRVALGELDDAQPLLDENAPHYEECRRCALLDQLVNCHITAERGGEGNRKLAREQFAIVRQEAEHERGILSPILFFEQHVLEHLDLG